ncbi:MAG: hypothetical protein WKG07_03830 [Hymenobacter sp.]
MTTLTLDTILAYQDENITSRFTDLLAVDEEEALDIFQGNQEVPVPEPGASGFHPG